MELVTRDCRMSRFSPDVDWYTNRPLSCVVTRVIALVITINNRVLIERIYSQILRHLLKTL
jgi:hypothetical protein